MSTYPILEHFIGAVQMRLDEMAKIAGPDSIRRELFGLEAAFNREYDITSHQMYTNVSGRHKESDEIHTLQVRLQRRREAFLSKFKELLDADLEEAGANANTLGETTEIRMLQYPAKSNVMRPLLVAYLKGGRTESALEDLYQAGAALYEGKEGTSGWPPLVRSAGGKPGPVAGTSMNTQRKGVSKQLIQTINNGCCTFFRNNWDDANPQKLELVFDFDKSFEKFNKTWNDLDRGSSKPFEDALLTFFEKTLSRDEYRQILRLDLEDRSSRVDIFRRLVDDPNFHPIQSAGNIDKLFKDEYGAAAIKIQQLLDTGGVASAVKVAEKYKDHKDFTTLLTYLVDATDNFEGVRDTLLEDFSNKTLNEQYPTAVRSNENFPKKVGYLPALGEAIAQEIDHVVTQLKTVGKIVAEAEAVREETASREINKKAGAAKSPQAMADLQKKIENIKQEVEEKLMNTVLR